ncbi:MAG: redoxin domain-containing protein, partial [Deltaproteobacteria bacterium]|nr:redoxin domain-containing protein [Deltaproteobacteria bacterium]
MSLRSRYIAIWGRFGVLAGILSTPCSGPFLGSVLAYAVTQPPAVIIVLFFAVGLGLAFPYSAILLFPQAAAFLPRGGRIGMQIESILAFILIAGAIFFGQSVIPVIAQTVLWWTFTAGLLLWIFIQLKRGQQKTERLAPGLLLIFLLIGGVTLFQQNGKKRLDWKPYSEMTFKQDMNQNHPVLLEFTADWCINCKVLEKTTYSSPLVINAATQVGLVPYQVDMTAFRDEEKDLLGHYGGEALPHAVLLDRSGNPVETFSGMFSADALVKAIFNIGNATASWQPQEGRSLIGTTAPEWRKIEWIEGGPLTLKELQGKVVLLRFWLTGCPYCIASAPALNEFWETYSDQGLVVVGLHHPKSEQTKKPEVIKEAAKQLGFQFPIGMDNSWETIRSYGVGSVFKNFTSVT